MDEPQTGGFRAFAEGAALLAFVLFYWGPNIWGTRMLADDQAYLCAFRAVANGELPYTCPRYLYPPAFAHVGRALLALLPASALMIALRLVNAVAVVVLLRLTLAFTPLRMPARLLVGATLVVFAPPLRAALAFGNVSPIVVAASLYALLRWPRHPVSAALLLGTALALKPLALMSVPFLWLHRGERAGARSRGVATGAATVALAWLLPWFFELTHMFAQDYAHPTAFRNVSLLRVLYLLGLEVSPLVIPLSVLLLCVALLRRRALRVEELALAVTAASVPSLPTVWNHAMLLLFPLMAAALTRAWARGNRDKWGRAQIAEALVVGVACLWLLKSNMFGDLGGFFDMPAPVAATLLLIPIGTQVGLLLYVLRMRGHYLAPSGTTTAAEQ